MRNEPGTIYNHAALSRNWHNPSILPDDLVLFRQEVYGQIPCHNHPAVELLHVERGRGVLTVNGREYQLVEGCGAFMFTHHFHEITAVPEETLHIISCQFSYRTYVYLTAILPSSALLPHNHSFCAFAHFPPSEQAHFSRIIDSLFSGNTLKKSQQYVPLLLEWIARFYSGLNSA